MKTKSSEGLNIDWSVCVMYIKDWFYLSAFFWGFFSPKDHLNCGNLKREWKAAEII